MAKEVKGNDEALKTIKSFALNSGFPFENDIHNIVRSLKHKGQREIIRPESFTATNEEGQPVIRSVDFRVSIKTPMWTIPHRSFPPGPNEGAKITFLVDAKYTTSDAWWFIPEVPRPPGFTAQHFPYLVPIYHEDAHFTHGWSTKMLPAFEVSTDLPRTTSGKKVALVKRNNEQQNDRDSLTQYQIQMSQAVLNRLEQQQRKLGTQYSEADITFFHDIELIVPIIATNAPLYLMNPDIMTPIIEQATEEGQIARRVDMVLLNQQPIARIQEAIEMTEATIKNGRASKFSWEACSLLDFPIFMVNVGSLGSLMEGLVTKFEQGIPKESLKK